MSTLKERFVKSITIPGEGSDLQFAEQSMILTEAARQRMAAIRFMNIVPGAGSPYEWRRRDALPAAHPEGSGASAQTTGNNSSYSKLSKDLKIIRSYGRIDEFVEETDYDFDTAAEEVLGCAWAVAYELTGTVFWGDSSANQYQFDGFDSDPNVQRINGGNATITKALIDQLIDDAGQAGSEQDQKMLFMSRHMRDALVTSLAGTQGEGLRVWTHEDVAWPEPGAAGGIRLHHYGGIPIMAVDFTRPRALTGTITGSAGGDGSLADGTYYYRLAAVTRFGEQIATPEVAVTVYGADGNGSVTLTLGSAFQHANSNYPYSDAMYYKLYRGTSSGNLTLVNTYNGLTYDASGTPTGAVTSFVDTGADLSSSNRGGAGSDKPLVSSDATMSGNIDECIFLVDLDPVNGCRIPCSQYASGGGPASYYDLLAIKRLADTADHVNFLVKTYALLAILQGPVHGVLRNVRAK